MSPAPRVAAMVGVLAVVALAGCGDNPDGPRLTLPGRDTVPATGAPPVATDAPPPAATDAPPAATDAPPPVVTDAPPPVVTDAPPVVTQAPPVVTEAPPVAPTEDDDSTTWWPWLLAAAAAVIAAVVVVARRRRPDEWTPGVVDSLDRAAQLARHLAALEPAGMRVVAADDARAVALLRADVQRLAESAPDDARRAQVQQLVVPLARLHSALDVVALSTSPSPEAEAAIAQAAALEVHTTVAAVRAVLVPEVG